MRWHSVCCLGTWKSISTHKSPVPDAQEQAGVLCSAAEAASQEVMAAAKSLPPSFIKEAIGNMRERCERLCAAAKGHHTSKRVARAPL